MNLDRSGLSADEYYATALHIFDYCGTESTGTLRVDTLMEKFAPFVKTNKAEHSYLKSLLDPDEDNPEISVTMLAKTLHKYSENQKKADLDESFNLLKNGQVPQDSDSGISTDGFQLLEELQCELKEKAHLAHQLRSQLDFTDRQHEEALAALTAERDSLKAHLNILREENMNLCDLRRDYEEVCERLCGSERALDEARRDLDAFRRRNKVMMEQVASLENEKLTLQELLSKSKAECHRINEMYAARQSALLEQNEALRTEHADLSTRLQDQEEFVQQMIKEKVLLEMELKDLLNKSNQTHLRMDRSIDVSFTDEQMLTALDSLNADSKFSQDNRNFDEESFIDAFKEDQGRPTNISLRDEIRLSLCFEKDKHLECLTYDNIFDYSFSAIGTQTEIKLSNDYDKVYFVSSETQTDQSYIDSDKTPIKYMESSIENSMQTENEFNNVNDKVYFVSSETQTNKSYVDCNITPIENIEFFVETSMRLKNERNNNDDKVYFVSSETQTEKSYIDSDKMPIKNIESSIETSWQTENELNNSNCNTQSLKTVETQTVNLDILNNNNNYTCYECEKVKKYTVKLESDVRMSHFTVAEMQLELVRYEENLNVLQKFVDDSNERNDVLQAIVKSLQAKISILETACAKQKELLNNFPQDVAAKKLCELNSVSTQAEIPCDECEKRNVPHRSLRRFLWTPIKCLFQLFALLCFICAISILYGVSTRARPSCPRDAVPWRWVDAQEIMDLLLRIEYVADVPM